MYAMPSSISVGRLLRLLGGVLDLERVRQQRPHGAHELGRGRAVLGRDRDAVELALAIEHAVRGLEVPRGDGAEAERVDLAVGHRAADAVAVACRTASTMSTVSPAS